MIVSKFASNALSQKVSKVISVTTSEQKPKSKALARNQTDQSECGNPIKTKVRRKTPRAAQVQKMGVALGGVPVALAATGVTAIDQAMAINRKAANLATRMDRESLLIKRGLRKIVPRKVEEEVSHKLISCFHHGKIEKATWLSYIFVMEPLAARRP